MRIISGLFLCIFLSFFVLWAVPIHAEIIYVNCNATGGNGSSWDQAYQNIGNALYNAGSGDQIWVAKCTYYEALEIDADQNNVSLYGGFNGDEGDLADRDHETNITIIDGSTADSGSPAEHVVEMDSVAGFTLDGFTITGGNSADVEGGGIALYNSDASLTDCTIRGNSCEWFGGGLFSENSQTTLSNCTIRGNSSGCRGGGLYLREGSSTLTNCTISGNTAHDEGGGIGFYDNDAYLTDCTIRGNSSESRGGGLYFRGCSSTLTNCTISGNSAGGGGSGGAGGIGIYNSDASLTDCTISDNSSYHSGGVELEASSVATLTDCTISGNSVDNNAGGLYSGNSEATLINCTISGNFADVRAGGLHFSNSNGILTNCTISGNSVVDVYTSNIGGIYFYYSNGILTNCIFENNLRYAVVNSSATTTITYSLFYNNSKGHSLGCDLGTGDNILDVDPAFIMHGPGALTGTWTMVSAYDADADTTTLTDDQASLTPGELAGRMINPQNSERLQTLILDNQEKSITVSGDWSHVGNATYLVADYHIRHSSGARDQGDNSAAPGEDIDGDARPYPVAGTVDMGVDEYNPATSDSDNDGSFDELDNCHDDPDKIAPGQCGCGTPDTDTDSDGIADCIDNCLSDSNPSQDDGDGDGVGDACDLCESDPDKTEPGDCGCGNPDIDSDNDGQSDCLNQAPEAHNQGTSVPPGQASEIVLSATDADDVSLTYSLVSAPLHGAVTISGNTATYTPVNGYLGTDLFTWQANDGLADSNTATVSIQVDVFYTLTLNKEGTGHGLVTSNPAGIDCGDTCAFDFQNGTQVTLSAAPNENSAFIGWQGGGCQGRDDCTVTLDQDISIIAGFISNTSGGSGGSCFLQSLY